MPVATICTNGLAAIVLFSVLCGCAAVPSSSDFKDAAYKAATDKRSWIPFVAAALWSIDDFDEQTSRWAVEHAPVFGSAFRADDYGNSAIEVMVVATMASSLLLPDHSAWKQGAHTAAIMGTTGVTTSVLKEVTKRDRPDYFFPFEYNDTSFPSGHASQAFADANILSKNTRYYNVSETWARGLDIGYQAFAWSIAWSRIEAQKHYPSDVLFGAALGNFIAVLFQEAFPIDSDLQLRVSQTPDSGHLMVNFQLAL